MESASAATIHSAEEAMRAIKPARQNIQTMARLEREALHQRTVAERISDAITRFIGSLGFLLAHLLTFVLWFLINTNMVAGVAPFDPFPFGILTLIVSAEGVLLAIFILISQNRMTRQSNKRDHLDLQINMLSKQEMTKLLTMVEELRAHLGIPTQADKGDKSCIDEADIVDIARDIDDKLPNQ
jgi:uncharacterized membrane protein